MNTNEFKVFANWVPAQQLNSPFFLSNFPLSFLSVLVVDGVAVYSAGLQEKRPQKTERHINRRNRSKSFRNYID